jgi:alpha-galactosidase
LFKRTADVIVSTGLAKAGYTYGLFIVHHWFVTNIIIFFTVNIDDCWAGTRDADGNIQPDPVAFPSGIRALADYVHSRNLKFGIYSGMKIIF